MFVVSAVLTAPMMLAMLLGPASVMDLLATPVTQHLHHHHHHHKGARLG